MDKGATGDETGSLENVEVAKTRAVNFRGNGSEIELLSGGRGFLQSVDE